MAFRRVYDVAVAMLPVFLSGVLTLATCVLLGQPLNFANVIALPLLIGIGVAFNIYFVLAWRAGEAVRCTPALARAVVFSALATATAFGALWLSSHPGTASMGKLLMIALGWNSPSPCCSGRRCSHRRPREGRPPSRACRHEAGPQPAR